MSKRERERDGGSESERERECERERERERGRLTSHDGDLTTQQDTLQPQHIASHRDNTDITVHISLGRSDQRVSRRGYATFQDGLSWKGGED